MSKYGATKRQPVEKRFTACTNEAHCLQTLRDIESGEYGGNFVPPTTCSGITPTSYDVLNRQWSCASLMG